MKIEEKKKLRNIRLEDSTWEKLRKAKKKSRLPWNLYLEQLIQKP
jgi:hypothetical protein